jgi:hypothetical protein
MEDWLHGPPVNQYFPVKEPAIELLWYAAGYAGYFDIGGSDYGLDEGNEDLEYEE